MKFISTVLSVLFLGVLAHAEIPERDLVSWDRHKPQTGQVIPASEETPFAQLKIANSSSKPMTAHITTLRRSMGTIIASGEIRYENVEGTAYIEMLTLFPNGNRYFARTLGTAFMAPIEGSSGWRPFVLTFSNTGVKVPSKLVFNLVLPGKGTVYIGPIHLDRMYPYEYAEDNPNSDIAPELWWSASASRKWAKVICGLFGSLIGILGVVIGRLAPRGRNRGFMMGLWSTFLTMSVAILIGGVIALGDRQPNWVYYPLIVTGFIGTAVMMPLTFLVRRIYERAELRNKEAQEPNES